MTLGNDNTESLKRREDSRDLVRFSLFHSQAWIAWYHYRASWLQVAPEFSIRIMDETYQKQNDIIQEIQDRMVAYFTKRQGPLAQNGISGKSSPSFPSTLLLLTRIMHQHLNSSNHCLSWLTRLLPLGLMNPGRLTWSWLFCISNKVDMGQNSSSNSADTSWK